jgi:mevalonate kinase
MMPEDYFQKNVEMWEKFTSSYMDTMFRMVEKSMDQSQVFKEQMDRVVNEAVSNQLNATMTTLNAMQKQMEILTEKMDELLQKAEAE